MLRSGRVNQWTGPYVDEFTTSFAARMGGSYGIALANGTLALELPLRVWGIGAGDEVIVSPRSFVASAACVSFVGATPVFADVDRDSGNITGASIAPRITARQGGHLRSSCWLACRHAGHHGACRPARR